MRIAITGAGGYVGAALVDALAASAAHDVLAVTRPGGTALAFPPGVTHKAADLADRDATANALRSSGTEAIVHAAAAIFSTDDPDSVAKGYRDNVEGTASLLNAASEAGVSGLVLLSSISVYGSAPLRTEAGFQEDDPVDPVGEYGRQKAEAERLALDWQKAEPGRHLIILRLAGVHGGRRQAGAVYRMIQSAKAGKDIQVTEPNSTFSFLHVGDAVTAIRCALSALPDAGAFVLNVAGGEIIMLTELATTIIHTCGSRSKIVPGDGTARVSALAVDKAREAIGFSPTPIADWIAKECRTGSASEDRP